MRHKATGLILEPGFFHIIQIFSISIDGKCMETAEGADLHKMKGVFDGVCQ